MNRYTRDPFVTWNRTPVDIEGIALIADQVVVRRDGQPKREFLHDVVESGVVISRVGFAQESCWRGMRGDVCGVNLQAMRDALRGLG